MLKDVKEYLVGHRQRHIDLLAEYVRKPSISADTVKTPLCAQFIRDLMEAQGIESRIYETEGQPLVWGEVRAQKENARTILFYGHYDVQPVEPLEEWISPPFEPEIREGRMYGRGTADNKGQHLAHVLAVHAWLQAAGELPVNVKFLFEGEEEAGSIHLEQALRGLKNAMAADLVVVSDGSFHESGRPRTSFGNRGGFYFRITVETADHDSHSGDRGGVIPNAGCELTRLIYGMFNEDRSRVLIEGFYDDLAVPTPYEERMLEALPFDVANLAEAAGVEKIRLDKRNYFLNLMYRPWLNLNSISCGQPQISRGAIPSKAFANFDVRMVKHQTAERVLEQVRAHVAKQDIYGRVTVERIGRHTMCPSKTDPANPLSRRVVAVVEESFGLKAVEYPVSPGTLPTYIWEEVLETPFIQIPYGNPDEHNHAPNENLKLNDYLRGIEISATILDALGE